MQWFAGQHSVLAFEVVILGLLEDFSVFQAVDKYTVAGDTNLKKHCWRY